MKKHSLVIKIVISIFAVVVTVFSVALISLYKTVDEINSEINIEDVSNDNRNIDDVNSDVFDVDDINKRVDNISKEINDLSKKITNYKDGYVSNDNLIGKEIENLKSDINNLYAKNNNSNIQNSDSNSEIEELKNRLSLLQATVDAQRNEINELKEENSKQIVGAIIAYGGVTLPENYLECNGQEVSRTDYEELFSIIGTTYGDGDGSTTFNLPNLQDKFPMASSTKAIGSFINPGLPNITGKIIEPPYPVNPSSYGITTVIGAFKNSTIGSSTGWTDGSSGRLPANTKYFSAADGEVHNEAGVDVYRNDIYGKSETVQPPALVIKYIIKVKK